MTPLEGLIPESARLLAPGRTPLSGLELRLQVAARAAALGRAGVAPEHAVAVALPDGPEMLLDSLATAAAAACAILNPALSEEELEESLRGLGARTLLAPPDSPAARAARRLGIPLFEPDVPLPEVPAARTYPNTALLLYTSATTGRPKLIPLSWENLLAMMKTTIRALELSSSDCFLGMMPLFHLQGFLSALLQWRAGGSVVATPGFDPRQFLSWMEEFQPTWYTAGPALHRAILSLDPFPGGRLRLVRSIGAPLDSALLSELESSLGVPVIEGYGLTETGLVTSNPLDCRKAGSVGRAKGPEVALYGGEIVVRGPSVFRGYAHDPEANRDTFRNGWFRTGDLGRFDDDGFLYILGRIKEMVNRGGEKVLPAEVDAVLAGHPAVLEAAAFAVPHATLGEDVAAAVVLRRGAAATESELRRFAAARLARFKIPRRILFLDAIPKGATGKPSRGTLSEKYERAASAPQPPSEPLERTLAAIWAAMLNVPEVGMADDFFELGGNSLLAANMLLRVEQECGCRLAGLCDPATLENLAALIRGEAPQAARTLFCIPNAGENPYGFRLLARYLGLRANIYVLRNPTPVAERGSYTVREVAEVLLGELRSVSPHGPYRLAGDCFGGIVAYELARLLTGAGEEVELLAMLDTPLPGYPHPLRDWRLYARAAVRLDWIRRSENPCREAWNGVRALAGRMLPSARRAPRDADSANRLAAREYRAVPSPGRIVQFAAADQWMTHLTLDSRLGWRNLAQGGFEVRYMAGQHDSLLREPYVKGLAQELSALLGEPNSS